MPSTKPPLFFSSQAHAEQVLGKLKLLDCPHCGQCGHLICNGSLKGNDPTQQATEQIERGQRIFCSNRGCHCGCGRSFSIYNSDTLPNRSIHTRYLSALLQAILDYAGCVHHAWQQGSRLFSLSSAYRLWGTFRNWQTPLRHRLCGRIAPPESKHSEPLLQLIAHLRLAFPDDDPIKAYQRHFQQPFLPHC